MCHPPSAEFTSRHRERHGATRSSARGVTESPEQVEEEPALRPDGKKAVVRKRGPREGFEAATVRRRQAARRLDARDAYAYDEDRA